MILKATLPLISPFSSAAEVSTKFSLRLPKVSPEERLLRAARRGGPVALGTPAAPYEPAGRSPLAALEGTDGLEIAVVTRSPEIVRELELLAELDRRSSVTVELMVPAADPVLAWKLEAVTRLAAEGIAVRVLCPLAAGVDDGEAALRKLLGAARDAGAWDVRALAAPGKRLRLSLRPRTGAALATFLRLRLEYGFPREMTGRG
jgi:DNA repair photolyase